MNQGLIIFAREPVPGRVKSRLAASIGEHAAAEQYKTMLREVLTTCINFGDVVPVVFWDCEEESLQLLSERYSCHSRRQSPGDLGQRMRAAFEEMFANGFGICCIIGSDAPDLPVSYIQEAFDLLIAQKADVVFGPAHDGGYYLLGMSRLWPQLFTDIVWSSPHVLRQSLAAVEKAEIKATLLPEWYDIDTQEDLENFWARNRGAL